MSATPTVTAHPIMILDGKVIDLGPREVERWDHMNVNVSITEGDCSETCEAFPGVPNSVATAQPTAKEHRCQSCGDLTDDVFCQPSCNSEGATS